MIPSSIRVMLVEDESFIRHTIRGLLRSLGAQEIREAADGTEALAALRNGFQPDIIFCDIQMTPMNGVTLLKAIRGASDPVLAAT